MVAGQFESGSDFPPQHLDYAHHNDDQDTVTLDSLTHSAFVPTNISFTSTSIDVNVSGLHYPSGAKQILDITTAA
jgi:hypothetical protein